MNQSMSHFSLVCSLIHPALFRVLVSSFFDVGSKEEDDDAAIPAGDKPEETDFPVIDYHVGEHSFAVMEDDHDQRRKEQLEAKPRDESEAAEHARR